MDATIPKKKVSLRQQLPLMLLGMGVGAAFGVIAVAIGHTSFATLGALGTGAKAALWALAILSFPLMVTVHEVGHVLGGMAVGFRPLFFMVGPLRIERAGDRVRTRVSWKGAIFGGLAACAPTDTRDLRRRTIGLIAGGPGINFAVALVLLGARPFVGPMASVVLLILGGMSLFIGMTSLIPTPAGNFYSDGQRIVRLLRGGDDVEREVAAIALMGMSMGGVRPREWSPELVARAAEGGADTLFGVVGRMYGFNHASDRGNTAVARAHLEAVLGGLHLLPPQSRPSLLLAAAFFAAHEDADTARARGYLAGSEGGVMVPPYLRPLAEAAITLAEGDRAAASGHLDAAEAALTAGTDPGAALAAAERIAAVRARLAAVHA